MRRPPRGGGRGPGASDARPARRRRSARLPTASRTGTEQEQRAERVGHRVEELEEVPLRLGEVVEVEAVATRARTRSRTAASRWCAGGTELLRGRPNVACRQFSAASSWGGGCVGRRGAFGDLAQSNRVTPPSTRWPGRSTSHRRTIGTVPRARSPRVDRCARARRTDLAFPYLRLVALASMGVSMYPGQIALARIPTGRGAPRGNASSPTSPAFEEQYAGREWRAPASIDAIRRTAEPWFARSRRSAVCVIRRRAPVTSPRAPRPSLPSRRCRWAPRSRSTAAVDQPADRRKLSARCRDRRVERVGIGDVDRDAHCGTPAHGTCAATSAAPSPFLSHTATGRPTSPSASAVAPADPRRTAGDHTPVSSILGCKPDFTGEIGRTHGGAHMEGRLEDRVAVITGAGQGIGRGIGPALRPRGLSHRGRGDQRETGARTVGEVAELGSEAVFIPTTSRSKGTRAACVPPRPRSGAASMCSSTRFFWGRASPQPTTRARGHRRSARDGTSVSSPASGPCRGVSHMKSAGSGSIITSAANGVNAHMFTVHYNAAKEALRAMSRTAAVEWGRHNIRTQRDLPGAGHGGVPGVRGREPRPRGDAQREPMRRMATRSPTSGCRALPRQRRRRVRERQHAVRRGRPPT